MSANTPHDRDDATPATVPLSVAALIAGIEAAGVAVNDEAAIEWLTAVAAAANDDQSFAVDTSGLGGHELALLDFDATSAERFRRIGALIGTPATPNVRPALAIAGSAAQGRIQPFPADADFFERIHILAADEPTARRRFAEIVRAGVARTQAIDGLTVEDVYFGRVANHLPGPLPPRAWTALTWTLAEVIAGEAALPIPGEPDAPPVRVEWEAAAADPGFVKIDWRLTDPALGGPGRVSKVIDATWQDPAGRIESLDGAIDADFQQVYLDAEAAATASMLIERMTPADRERYLQAMEREVAIYAAKLPPNFGKVARRLYNICRMTGHHPEALFLRELFDEPVARLYQAHARLEFIAIRHAAHPGGAQSALLALVDEVCTALHDEIATRSIVDACRDLAYPPSLESFADVLSRVDRDLERRSSAAFGERLLAYAPIAAMIEAIQSRHDPGATSYSRWASAVAACAGGSQPGRPTAGYQAG